MDFPALRARAHMSAPAVLWISQPFGLGRIYPRLTPLWISGGGGEDDKRAAEGCGVAPYVKEG